jgi:hypothetical protein
MKTILAVILAAVLIPCLSFAEFSSVGFAPYSSTTAMSCSVLAGKYTNGAFTPNPGTSTVLPIGHNPRTLHIYNNVSSVMATRVYTPTGADTHLKVDCYPTSTGPTNAYSVSSSGTRTTAFSSYTSTGGFRTGAESGTITQTFGSNLRTFVKMYFNGSSTFTFPITETFLSIK